MPSLHLIEAWWTGANPGVTDAAARRAAAYLADHPEDAAIVIGPRTAIERAAAFGLVAHASVCPILGSTAWSRRTILRRARDLAAIRPGLLASSSRVVVWTPGAYAAASLLELEIVDRNSDDDLPLLTPPTPRCPSGSIVAALLTDPPTGVGALAAAYGLSLAERSGLLERTPTLLLSAHAADLSRVADFLAGTQAKIRLVVVHAPVASVLASADLIFLPPCRSDATPVEFAARRHWLRHAIETRRRVMGAPGDPYATHIPSESDGTWSRAELGRALDDLLRERHA